LAEEKERIGVYVCKCGLNIAGVVDTEEVARHAKSLENVVVSVSHRYTCSDAAQAEIIKEIKERKLNRVVVAACSPNLHEKTFRKMLQEAGLNPYLFEMANIREHCSWVHYRDPAAATEKAKDLVRMAVAKARLIEPLPSIKVPVERRALVVGGGIAGMQAALDLGNMGYEVVLIERLPTIGGRMAQLDKTFPTMDCSICIEGPMMSDVGKHEKITLLTYHELKEVEGYVGNFTATIVKKPRYVDLEACNGCGDCYDVCPVKVPSEWEEGLGARGAIYRLLPQSVPNKATIDKRYCIDCKLCEAVCEPRAIRHDDKEEEFKMKFGTIIVATGYDIYDPREKNDYHYLDYPNVITGLELERLMNASGPTQGHVIRPSDGEEPKRIGFILCVGTRDRGDESYCSGGVCCMYSIKLASMLKEKHPEYEIYLFYIDIRAYGKGFEEMYTRARNKGIKFIRGKPGEVTEDPKTKNLKVVVENSLAGTVDEIELDMVVLSTGMVPKKDALKVARTFKLSRSAEGFFLEKHPKLAPVDTPTDGIFLAGACQGPKDVPTSVVQARAAATAAASIMAAGEITLGGDIAYHLPEKCIGCARCVKACPYGAWELVEVEVDGEVKKRSKLTSVLCKGCGTCAAECPTAAIEMKHFTDAQIQAQIEAALEEDPGSKILGILCNWCSYGGADTAGTARMQYPTNLRIVRVMCTGRVNRKFIERAFELGAGMVLVAGCHPGDCHYISGNKHMAKREKLIRRMLDKKGISQERFRLEWISASEGAKFQQVITEMAEKLEELKEQKVEVKTET
jgi:heterodisulfide reductase subunit A